MWCVVCRTAFSWNTGLIEDGHIHNPHYYQFLREQKAKEEAEAEVEDELRPVCGIRDNALHWMCRRLRLVESQLGNKGKEGAGGNVVPLEERAPLNMMIEYIRYTNHISEVTVKQLERKQTDTMDFRPKLQRKSMLLTLQTTGGEYVCCASVSGNQIVLGCAALQFPEC
jgi:hypothetical protein